tara:strand:+ start:123 stop:728 length:606 start_codon:yes stop_codon:yes gene_type:complete
VKLFGKSDYSFIEIYDNALTKKECEILINQFEKSDQTSDGKCFKEGLLSIDYSFKKCQELNGCEFDKKDCSKEVKIINNIIFPCLSYYVDEYYKKYDSLKHISQWTYATDYNFQKYETEDDGFKLWHCEHGTGWSSERVMAWMFYLNDAKSGTEFMYYPTISAKRGRFVIWPAFWTHTHRGSPNKGLKYIITGWLRFNQSK